MKISSISNNIQTFKSNLTFDIGGSQREGSCKIYYATTKDDKEIFRKNTTVNELGRMQFNDSEDFVRHLVEKTKNIQKFNGSKIEKMGYGEDENIIKNIAIFLPSYTCGTHAFYLPNHRNLENRPLKDVDFSNFKEKLKMAGVDIAPDATVKIIQDAMGAGLAMTKKLYDKKMLNEGSYYTVCITGGGCGISNIEMYDKDTIVVKSSGSSYLSQSLSLQKVSKAGASAPALIENFGRAMGFNEEEIEDLKSCHKAEFTMQNPCTYDKNIKTEKLKQYLLNTGKYTITEDLNSFTIKIKPEYIKHFDRSRKNAIDKYCLALARLAIIKKTEGSNGMIITGPVAKSVNNAAKKYYDTSVSDWVSNHLRQSFNSYELEKMQKAYHFKIICDDGFQINDNTECKNLAYKAKFVNPVRGNWVRLNTNDLKN